MKSFETEIKLQFLKDNKGLKAASSEVGTLNRKVKLLRAEFKRLGVQALAQLDKIAAGLVRTGKRFMMFGALGIAALGAVAVKTSQAGAKLEGYRVTFRQLYGDAAKGEKALSWIMGMQVKTPYTPDELLAALKPLKIFGMDAKKWLPAIGDMASTMGKDIVDAATGVAKAFSAGQAGADALRESYGVTMANLVKISGYTEKELRNDMEKYRDALFTFITDPKFKGGMARYAATFKGLFSSIKGGLQTFVMFTGEAINKVMKADFQKMVDWIVRAYESGKLEEWAKRVAEGFKKIWQGIKRAGQVIWKFVGPIVKFFKEHPNMLKWAIAAIAAGSAISLLGGGIMTLTGKLWQLGRGLVGGIGKLKAFGGTIGKLFSTLKHGGGIAGMLAGKGGILGGIGKMAGGIGGKLAGAGGIAGKLGGVLGAGGAAAGGGIAASLSAAIPILGAVVAAGALFATAWKKNFANIREAAAEAFKPVKKAVVDLGLLEKKSQGTEKKAGGPLKRIGSVFKEVWLGLSKVAAPVFKFLMKALSSGFRVFKAILDPIIAIIRNVLGFFRSLGGEAEGVKGVFTGIANVVGWVFDKLGAVLEFIVSAFEWFIGLIAKPFGKLADKVGGFVVKMKTKLGDFFAKSKDSFTKVREEARHSFGFMKLIGEKLIGKLIEGFAKLKQKVIDTLKKIGDWFAKLWTGIKKGAAAAWNWVKTKLIDPLAKAFRWLRDKVFKPIGEFFAKLFDPLVKGFKKAWAWIKGAIGSIAKLGGKALEWLGIDAAALKELREWAEAEPVKKAKGAEGAGAGEDAPPAVVPGMGAGGGGAGGGGGPTIQNNYVHNHLSHGAIIINAAGDIEAMKKGLIEIFGAEVVSVAG